MDKCKIIFLLMETSQPSISTSSNNTSSSDSSDTSSNESWIVNNIDNDVDTLFFPLIRHLVTGRKRRRVENYLEIVESWTDVEFNKNFRLSRRTAYQLIDELERSDYIPKNRFGMKPVGGKICFFIFLWFMANTEPLRTMADRFDISISSTFRIIRRVLSWLLTKLDDVIKWPETPNEIINACDGFYSKKNIPHVLGAIDCTHICIIKPSANAADYYNRKKYFSINLQAVADSKLRFTNVYCGEPGSLHDARVLKRSPLYEEVTRDKDNLFPNNTLLIGDSAYPSLSWLVTPFRDNGHLTPEQAEFNYLHSSTRMAIEKAFGMLKNRFRRIKFFTEYRNISFITKTIVAACVLHNYCINEQDYFDDCENNHIHVRHHAVNDDYADGPHVDRIGRDRRTALFRDLFPDI